MRRCFSGRLYVQQRIEKRAAYAALAFAMVLAGGSGVQAASLGDAAPQLPRKAMPFGIQTGPDKYIWLSDYEGKTCVLAFILTTCPHCQFTDRYRAVCRFKRSCWCQYSLFAW